MSQSDDNNNASQGSAGQDWLSQLSDPKAWQSMMNVMQPGMAGMSGMSGMPGMTGPAASSALHAMVPPEKLAQLQSDYMTEMSRLWTGLMSSQIPDIKDRRFSTPAWKSSPYHAFSAATYLLNAKFMNALADAVEVDEKIRKKFVLQSSRASMRCRHRIFWQPIRKHSKKLSTPKARV